MSGSMIPACVDAAVALLDAALAIEVRDGGQLQNLEAAGLLIGTDGGPSEFPWSQTWAGQAHVARDETFDIPCVLFDRSADNAVSACRTEVFGYMATVESTLRNNPTLGISTNTVRAEMAGGRYAQPNTPDGVVCRIDFTIRVTTRI